MPQHVVQRGNDRQPCFFEDVDRLRYLDQLREIRLEHGCAIHAYALMTNHDALGSDHFRAAIEKQLARNAGPAKIGRPRKAGNVRESAL